MNQTMVASIQESVLGRIKAYFAGWWKRHIVDDFKNHFPGEPWMF